MIKLHMGNDKSRLFSRRKNRKLNPSPLHTHIPILISIYMRMCMRNCVECTEELMMRVLCAVEQIYMFHFL